MYISSNSFSPIPSSRRSQQSTALAQPKMQQRLFQDQVHFQGRQEEDLQAAVKNDKKDLAKTLVHQNKADINRSDKYGETLLNRAVRRGKLEDIEFLLKDLQANPNQVDDKGWTPLSYAASKNQWPAIPLLRRYQADLNLPNGNQATPLIIAIQKENFESTRALLSAGADPYATDGNEQNAITHAAGTGNVRALDLLAEKKVDFDAQDKAGWTPLTIAASYNKPKAIRKLHQLDANFKVPDVKGRYADQCAQLKGHKEVRNLIWELQNSSTKKKLTPILEEDSVTLVDEDSTDEKLVERLEQLRRQGTASSSTSESLAFIGIDTVPGIYPDKQALKSAQWEKRLDLVKTGLFLATAATAITVGIVFPPALPATAGGAALLDPTVQKMVASSLSGAFKAIGGLMGNREAFPKAKKKALKALSDVNEELKKRADFLRKTSRFKAHAKFLDRLANVFDEFAQTIKNRTSYEDCLLPYMEFEEKLHAALGSFLQEQGQLLKEAAQSKAKSKEKTTEIKTARSYIRETQEFLRKYAKYMNQVNKDLLKDGEISEEARHDLVNLEKMKQSSQIPIMQEWANSEQTLAYALPRLRSYQVTADSPERTPLAEKAYN